MSSWKVYSAILCLFLLLNPHNVIAQPSTQVEVIQSGSVFNYVLRNNEPTNSKQSINTFNLTVSAPITVTNSPPGWDFITDNRTYVDWFNTDSELPLLHDIAPGSSLSGFTIESAIETTDTLPYGLTFWDHGNNAPGIGTQGMVKAPFSDAYSFEAEEYEPDIFEDDIFLPLIKR